MISCAGYSRAAGDNHSIGSGRVLLAGMPATLCRLSRLLMAVLSSSILNMPAVALGISDVIVCGHSDCGTDERSLPIRNLLTDC